MYKVEVIADSSNKWCGNGLKFATVEEAETYARDLFSRWTAVRQWRIVDAETSEVVSPVSKPHVVSEPTSEPWCTACNRPASRCTCPKGENHV